MVHRGIVFLGKCCMMNEGETLNLFKRKSKLQGLKTKEYGGKA